MKRAIISTVIVAGLMLSGCATAQPYGYRSPNATIVYTQPPIYPNSQNYVRLRSNADVESYQNQQNWNNWYWSQKYRADRGFRQY